MWEKSASYPNECCWVTSTSHSLILILLIKPTLLLSIFFTQSFIVAALSLFLNHLTHTSIFFLHLFLCLSFLPSLFSETEAQSAAEELMHRAIALCPPTTPTGISPNLRITCTGLSRLPTVSCQFCSSQYKVNAFLKQNLITISWEFTI